MYGKRIRRLRQSKKMTLKELGQELHMPTTTLANYEREEREPNIKTLIKIADYFGISVDQLIR